MENFETAKKIARLLLCFNSIKIPKDYKVRIEGDKIVLEPKKNEDDRIRKAIRCYIEDMPDTYSFALGIGKADMLAYIEKQKEQNSTEWSEEDEMHLNNAILAAEKEWGVESCTAKFLKSLPERFNLQSKINWKPSEEQMEALLSAEIFLRAEKQYYSVKIIAELYKQLKELL